MYRQVKTIDGFVSEKMVQRTTDEACIPFDPANTDYQEFLRWKEQGNEPLPPDA